RALALVLALAAAFAATAAPAPARADDATALADYDPSSRTWNGLYTFTRVAAGLDLTVMPVATLEWSDLGASDILVLIYPLQRVDPARLSAFVQAGGHVVVADDFGRAGDALSRLGLLRADVGTAQADRYYKGRLYAPIAIPLEAHPLTRGITEVVTNHPAVLTEVSRATPVIGFGGGRGAIVVAGEAGTGRFVVVSDPSIFINRMMQFPGNLTLAVNILRWLDREGRVKRVVILRGDVPMYGTPKAFIDDERMGPVDRSVTSVNEWLQERNDWLLTPAAMRVIGGSLAVALAVLALAAMPPWRRVPMDGRWLALLRPERADHLPTLVAGHDRGHANFAIAAAALRDTAAGALARATGHPDPLHQLGERDLVALVTQARGADAGRVAGALYKPLRALPGRSLAAAPWTRIHVGARELMSLDAQVTELCRRLGDDLDAPPPAAQA
ncbi:MAG TPA: DUF4350 domain-containing protein, partial [Kofleriaceae bacterium]|nr:DUF4350 domain-containing protein [Kofleriaceae bacterium]